jgi:5-amino-6-(5-phosphoribosylamino)uracil reductase
MPERPYTLLSCAVSLDGYLSGGGSERLVLSNSADLDRVDAVRAGCDAILVGAETLRSDNPHLVTRSVIRREVRLHRGEPASPARVTVTRSGRLDAQAHFFADSTSAKLVYCATGAVGEAQERVGSVSTVIAAGEPVEMGRLSEDLHRRGVQRLMVEGGGRIHTQFLLGDLVDELHLVLAPFFVGDPRARRFVGDGSFPWNSRRRATLVEVRQLEDMVLLRYALSSRFGSAEGWEV